ncbi:MAG TPA: hypothetical protein VEY12_12225 [Thermoplasmata archaeon]|nr:hypothetical protein [Thermoplasmata archaeon]
MIAVAGDRQDKVISENHTLKVLAERNGLLVSLTTKRFSYLVFLSRPLVGVRKIVTKDRIVARAGYDIRRTLQLIDETYGRGGL